MENTIILMPPVGGLRGGLRPEPEVITRLPERRAVVQPRIGFRASDRARYVAGLDPKIERIYGLANLVAVIVMAVALVVTFGLYLTAFAA
jgi:hypothetical protein